jgi:hypothetical protein
MRSLNRLIESRVLLYQRDHVSPAPSLALMRAFLLSAALALAVLWQYINVRAPATDALQIPLVIHLEVLEGGVQFIVQRAVAAVFANAL